MKKKTLISVFALILIISAVGQNASMELTFMALDNRQIIPVNSILIENLTRQVDTTLYTPDTILVLDYLTGIDDNGIIQDNNFTLLPNYPNPFYGETKVSLNLPENEHVNITVRDITGAELTQYENTLNIGKHAFTFFSGNQKYYLLTVSGEHSSKTIKMLNTNINTAHAGNCKIAYNGYQDNNTDYKPLKEMHGFLFELGDELKFTCYSDIGERTITDIPSPAGNQTYAFQFEYSDRVEVFTFQSGGNDYKGKIFLPASYETNGNLPAIFLIDYTEQHYRLATDEFEKVISGVKQIQNFDALVVSLENIPDIDANPNTFQDNYEVYKNMASYVDSTYTNNSSRTFIGKGSEAGVVLMALFIEDSDNTVFDNFIATDPSPQYVGAIIKIIENDDFPKNKLENKLHFSFSTSNDRSSCNRLINLIKNAHYQWLQFESIEYTNSNYENTYPISFAAGIKFVFDY